MNKIQMGNQNIITLPQYALSPMQKSMLVASYYLSATSIYNVQVVILLQEAVDTELFKICWNEIHSQYEHFRAALTHSKNQDVTIMIHKEANSQIQKVDLSTLETYKKIKEWKFLINNELQKEFNLYQPPLIRALLVKYSDSSYRLVITFHHILFDGDSYLRMSLDLFGCYDSKKKGLSYSIKSQPYPEVSKFFNKEISEEEINHWKTTFSDFNEQHLLCIKKHIPDQPPVNDQIIINLSQHLSNKLKKLSQQFNLTPSIIFEAAWGLLLSKYSYSRDVVFSVIQSIPSKAQIGLFINALPIRCRFNAITTSLSDYLNEIRHQHKAFKPFRTTSINEIFKINKLNVQSINTAIDYKIMEPIAFMKKYGDQESWKNRDGYFNTETHYDLFLEIFGGSERFKVKLNFYRKYYIRKDIFQLLHHLILILESMVAYPNQNLSSISLSDSGSSALFQNSFQSKETNLPASHLILDFIHQGFLHKNKVAAKDSVHSISYHSLHEYSSYLASYLTKLGAQATDIITICMDRNINVLISMLGVIKLGSAYLPMDANSPEDRIRFIFEDSRSRFLITDTANIGNFSSLLENIVVINIDEIDFKKNNSEQESFISFDQEQLAYIIYTSGSTGKPKGVRIKHSSLINLLFSVRDRLSISSKDTMLALTSIGFDISGLEFYIPIICGAKLVIAENVINKNPIQLMHLLKQEKITILQATPSTFQMLLEVGWKNDGSIKILCGGEPLNKDVAAKLLEQGHGFWHCYGPTETTIWSAINYIDSIDSQEVWIPFGNPIANTQLYILDPQKQPLPHGLVGEIYIAGAGLAEGYVDPELTTKKFIWHEFNSGKKVRLYQTGDLACWLPNGLVNFKGRIDHQVKLRGHRIELGEIEAILRSLQKIKNCAVIVKKTQSGMNHYLVAFIEKETFSLAEDEVRTCLAKRLPEYMIPSQLLFVDKLPLTPNGKLDYKKLQNDTVNEATALEEQKTSRFTNQFKQLCAIVLDCPLDKIGASDNFFELGGNSLSAFSLIMKIEAQYHVILSIKDIHEYSTLGSLSEFIQHKKISPLIKKKIKTISKEVVLTDFQKRLWILDHLGSSSAYNLALLLQLKGPLNIKIFEKSIDYLMKRQTALLIKFHEKHTKIYQAIDNQCRVENILTVIDRSKNHKNIEAELIAELAEHHFDLSGDHLFKIKLIKISSDKFYLGFCIHHIIIDEWSARVFLSELSKIYNYLQLNQVPELSPLSCDYLRYIEQELIWDNEDLTYTESQLTYWVNQLKDFKKLNLPYDYKLPKIMNFEGDVVKFSLSAKTTQRINKILKEQRITLTSFLLSMVNILLNFYTSNEDIVIGMPISLRKDASAENLISPCINTVVIRTQISLQQSLVNFIKSIQKLVLEANTHADLPFEKLIEALHLHFEANENPIFQVFFALQENLTPYFDLANIKVLKTLYPIKKAKFNLSFYFIKQENHIEGVIEFRKDLFKSSTIERFSKTFTFLIEQCISKVTAKLSDLHPVTTDDEHTIQLFNETNRVFPQKTVLDIIKTRVNENPNHIAVVYEKEQLTYSALDKCSNKVAQLLLKQQISSETLIGICVSRSLLLPIGLLGILKAKAAYVPIDPDYPTERIKYFIEHSGLKIILCDHQTLEIIQSVIETINYSIELINLSSLSVSQDSSNNTQILTYPTQKDLAYVIYTSGSTGKPKGVAIEHSALTNFIYAMQELKITSRDRLLSITPISFDIFGLELFLPLTAGATIVLTDRTTAMSAGAVNSLIDREKITVLQATPSTWKMLLDANWKNDGSLKVLCGGEALNKAIAAKLLEEGHGFWHCYGPTETTIWSTYEYITALDEATEWVNIGRPISNTRILILDQNRRPVPLGAEGEIYIAGTGLARGYWGDPDITVKSFILISTENGETIRSYRTGDKGSWNEYGRLLFKGRSDQQIKLHGYRIEIGEIESCLSHHASVKEAAITLVGEHEDTPYLNAFIVPNKAKNKAMDFSILFFPADKLSENENPYDLYFDAAQFAEENGFTAIWTPERHFNQVGGQFPNPSILTAALSKLTKRIQLRAGSVVIPLHNPIRVAEDWSVLDQLSGGRVGLSLASGWHPQDFVLHPEGYQERKMLLEKGIQLIQTLWSGQSLSLVDGNGEKRTIHIYPRPLQKVLPLWLTAAENPDTFRMAGRLGCHVLTHLLGQDLNDLAEKITIYHDSLRENGFDPSTKIVTLAVHTFLGENHEKTISMSKPYFIHYLKSHASLLSRFNDQIIKDISAISEEELDVLIDHSMQRFLEHNSLIGSIEHGSELLKKLTQIGVKEIACLIDFGLPKKMVLEGLEKLKQLKQLVQQDTFVNSTEIRNYLSKCLPYYMLPKQIIQVDALPRTPNNKIDRIALKKLSSFTPKLEHIPPKTIREKQLIHLIKTLYKVKDISMNQNLNDLGGSSLLAVRLISEIKGHFAVEISIRDFFELSNIQELMDFINKKTNTKTDLLFSEELNPIVKLKAGGNAPPLFLIHPVGGTVFCYRPLAKYLSLNRTIYGIQDPGIMSGEKLFDTFDQMVDFYVQAIQKIIPSGEVCLAGASFGGTLALEMGSKLINQGKKCAFVGLFDTWAIFPEDLKKKSYFEENMIRQHNLLSSLFKDYDVQDPQKWLDLQWHRQMLLMQYQPHEINHPNILLFKAQDLRAEYVSINEESNYWNHYLKEKLTVLTVPGDHESLLKEPYVLTLAQELDQCLQQQHLLTEHN